MQNPKKTQPDAPPQRDVAPDLTLPHPEDWRNKEGFVPPAHTRNRDRDEQYTGTRAEDVPTSNPSNEKQLSETDLPDDPAE